MPRRTLRKPHLAPPPTDDTNRPLTTTASVHFIRPLLVSRFQGSEMLGVSQRTFDHLLKHNKKIKAKLVGSRRMIVLASLEAFCNDGTGEKYSANPVREARDAEAS